MCYPSLNFSFFLSDRDCSRYVVWLVVVVGFLILFPERGFIDWLFTEAAKGAPESELGSQTQTQPTDSQPSLPTPSLRQVPPDPRRNPPSGPRSNAPLY